MNSIKGKPINQLNEANQAILKLTYPNLPLLFMWPNNLDEYFVTCFSEAISYKNSLQLHRTFHDSILDTLNQLRLLTEIEFVDDPVARALQGRWRLIYRDRSELYFQIYDKPYTDA